MRLDKYLKLSRIIKRRTVAKDVSELGRVLVNDKVVKPSYQVKIGDILTVVFGNNTFKCRVLTLSEHPRKDEAKEMFEML